MQQEENNFNSPTTLIDPPKLKQQKETLKDNEAITNDVVGQAHVSNFAFNTFDRADKQDRAGKADKLSFLILP